MANKQVLLARPHAFIVAEMLPFLEEAGYSARKLGALDELASLAARDFAGVVISNAVVSSINASAEQVFAAVRARMPSVPVLFAGLTEFAVARGAVERAVRTLHPTAEIVPAAANGAPVAGLGRATTFLVLSKDDLDQATRRSAAIRALRGHFRAAAGVP